MTALPEAQGHSLRLFYAVVPDAGVRDALAELAREVARETGGRAARAENLHLTLAFLGNVPQERIADVAGIGAKAAEAAAPFLLTLGALGVFRDAGVAWAGPQAIPQNFVGFSMRCAPRYMTRRCRPSAGVSIRTSRSLAGAAAAWR